MAAPSDYLAAERTFLAWLRTGLALMGLGFVVARFGLFLQQIAFLQRAPLHSSQHSLWLGTLLIAAGIVVSVFSAWRHVRLVRQFDAGLTPNFSSSTAIIVMAAFLALIGLGMAIYLLTLH